MRSLRHVTALACATIMSLLAFSTGAAAHASSSGPMTMAGQSGTSSAVASAAGEAAPHYPVTLSEMTITTGWIFVPSGPIVLDIRNAGTVTHELAVIRTDVPAGQLAKRATDSSKVVEDGRVGEAEDIAPGTTVSLPLYLYPGKYVLICNLPGHHAAGMHTGFTAVTYVGVSEKEMSITLDRTSVPAGPVVFGVTNAGAVEHELAVIKTSLAADKLPTRATDATKVDETGSAGEVEAIAASHFSGLMLTLAPGSYVLLCNLPGHYAAGMRTALTVTPNVVSVTLTEMKVQPAQASVLAGPVRFTVANAGAALHELVILKTTLAEDKLPVRATDATKVEETGSVGELEDVAAGATGSLDVTLTVGSYVLICNKPGHYAAGMHTAFSVQ